MTKNLIFIQKSKVVGILFSFYFFSLKPILPLKDDLKDDNSGGKKSFFLILPELLACIGKTNKLWKFQENPCKTLERDKKKSVKTCYSGLKKSDFLEKKKKKKGENWGASRDFEGKKILDRSFVQWITMFQLKKGENEVWGYRQLVMVIAWIVALLWGDMFF